MKISFDKFGKPEEQSLMEIENIKLPKEPSTWEDFICEVLDAIAEAWSYSERVSKKDGLYVFSTAGWSGNEKLISAFLRSVLSLTVDWERLSGGFYVIAVSEKARKILAEKVDSFVIQMWDEVRPQVENEGNEKVETSIGFA